MTSTALSKELQTYLPNLGQAPEVYRPMLAHQYAELVRRTEDRMEHFMPGPEQSRIKAEMVAAANHMLSQALLQDRPSQPSAALEVGPAWQSVGLAFGQLAGYLVRGAAELVWGLVCGVFQVLFAAGKPAPKRREPEQFLPTVAPCEDFRNNVHVRVEVDVKIRQ